MRLPSTSLVSLSLLSTALIACGDTPPEPSEVRAALRDDLGRILREAEAASGAVTNLPAGSAFGFATSALGGVDGTAARAIARDRSSGRKVDLG